MKSETSNIEVLPHGQGTSKPRKDIKDSKDQSFTGPKAAAFANSLEAVVGFTNDAAEAMAIDGGGWAQLAPFGDFPGQAMRRAGNGVIEKCPAVQRLDRAAAKAMVARFKSPWQRFKRFFTGCPIFAGHPDVPGLANEYADKSPKGMIVDLEARENGLYCKPVFTREGSELVESRRLRALSAYWSAEEIGEESGVKIFRPELLNSAGLTNRPNLPVELLNEGSALSAEGSSPSPRPSPPGEGERGGPVGKFEDRDCSRRCAKGEPPKGGTPSGEAAREDARLTEEALEVTNKENRSTQNTNMNREIVIRFLGSQGISLANEAEDGEILAALERLGERVTVAETTLAARQVEFESVGAELANERRFHADTLLDAAMAAGRITAAQRPEWASHLEADFANGSAELSRLKPALKTVALTANLGSRKAEIANAGERRDAVDALVKAEMARNGGDYDRAFAKVQRANPALFAAMKQPGGN